MISCGCLGKPLILLAAPQGFEPRYADPESAVLPLNEGAATAACVERAYNSASVIVWLYNQSVNHTLVAGDLPTEAEKIENHHPLRDEVMSYLRKFLTIAIARGLVVAGSCSAECAVLSLRVVKAIAIQNGGGPLG